jgi:hypothetical protein
MGIAVAGWLRRFAPRNVVDLPSDGSNACEAFDETRWE